MADEQGEAEISVRKKVRAEKQQDADKYNSKTKPQITVGDKVVTVNANTQGAGDKGVTTDMDIYVPANTALVITSGQGDVTVAGMTSNVEVNHHRGEVNINDHTGNVLLNLDGSSARLAKVKGDVTIRGSANEIAIEDVDGAVHLDGEFQESMRLVRISKTVSFRSSRTDMEFSRLDGRLDLDSGDLRADAMTRADAPENAVERYFAGRLVGRSAAGRLERVGRGRTVQAGKYPDR